jgi:hypothetical protein
VTKAEHLLQAGQAPPTVDVPAELQHVWEWFWDLSEARAPGFSGPGALGYGEIAAWAALTGARPTAREIAALRAMDGAFLAEAARARG